LINHSGLMLILRCIPCKPCYEITKLVTFQWCSISRLIIGLQKKSCTVTSRMRTPRLSDIVIPEIRRLISRHVVASRALSGLSGGGWYDFVCLHYNANFGLIIRECARSCFIHNMLYTVDQKRKLNNSTELSLRSERHFNNGTSCLLFFFFEAFVGLPVVIYNVLDRVMNSLGANTVW
jgi:hypothetical protein